MSTEHLHNMLTNLFRQALDGQPVDDKSNFFSLGGQSLQAAQLVAEIGRLHGKVLPLRAFFEDPTIGGVLHQLQKQEKSTSPLPLSESPAAPVALPPALPGEDFPLNEVQHAYWMGRSSFFEMGNVATHVYVEFDSPTLDLSAFERAWNRVCVRHDMLRAVITEQGQQRILDVFHYDIERIDLLEQDVDTVQAARAAIRERMSHQVLDCSRPLYQIVASISAAGVRLHCSLDLLIADLWSTQVLFRDLQQAYCQPELALDPLTFTFRDYVLTEQAQPQGATYQQAREYWQDRLGSLPKGPELPLHIKPSSVKTPRFVRRSAGLDPAQWQALRQLAERHALTPSGLLATAYAEVLALWSGNRHFCLNLTLFNRLPLHPEVGEIIGDFTSLSLLEINTAEGTDFMARARLVQAQLWNDLDHRDYGGLKVMRDYARHHHLNNNAFPVVFTSALVHGNTVSTDFIGETVYQISQTPQIWLDHQVFEEHGKLIYNWDAVEEIFPPGMLDDMFAAYRKLLDMLVHQDNLDMLPAALLPTWQGDLFAAANATTTTATSNATLLSLFLDSTQRHAQRIALRQGGLSLSYMDLLSRVRIVAAALVKAGVGHGSQVAVIMSKGWEQVVAVLGCHYAGAAYVPIDATTPADRCAQLLQQAGTRVALCQPWTELPVSAKDEVFRIEVVNEEGNDATLLAPSDVQPHDLAYVIFTSGSTGLPKGVMIDHRGAVNTLLDIAQRIALSQRDVVFGISALNFDLSVFDIFGTLGAGATLVLPRPQDLREAGSWLAQLQQHRVTVWNSVPALMGMLLEYRQQTGIMDELSLRVALLSGDWIPVALPARLVHAAPGCRVISLGGATEASIWSIQHDVDTSIEHRASIPYGKPLANQAFHVLDKFFQPTPVWTTGELYITGTGLALGYLNDAAKTDSAFLTIPGDSKRYYRTGDLGRYLPDGDIEFLGRKDEQVKINGHRIELGEIETALERQPGVLRAAVTVHGEPASTRKLYGFIQTIAGHPAVHRELAGLPPMPPLTPVIEPSPMPDLMQWRMLYAEVDRIIACTYGALLTGHGLFVVPGQRHDFDEVMRRSAIITRYAAWTRRALEVLVEDGWLRCEGKSYVSLRALPEESPAPAAWRALAHRAREHGIAAAGLEFAARSAEVLPTLLNGRTEAVAVLFEDGRSQQAVDMYEDEFTECNSVLACLFKDIVTWAHTQKPKDRPLRILEIGAGIGSSTRHVLPLLASIDVNYCYTDISPYFLQHGRDCFGNVEGLEYRLLDIEKNAIEQGFSLHDYDIVLAASVLHATRDIAMTLDHVRQLMAPGGLLVLIEETLFPRIFNLTMGLQTGFDRFEDHDLRHRHPLLTRAQWLAQLDAAGFTTAQGHGRPETPSALLGLDVITAQAPEKVLQLNEEALLMELARQLPDYMIPTKLIGIESMPLSDNGKVRKDRLPSPWTQRTRFPFTTPPSTVLEKRLAMLFEDALGVEPVGLEDNFFDLGGDSLLATRLIARVRAEFGITLTIRVLFEHPTVGGIARHMEATIPVARAVVDYHAT